LTPDELTQIRIRAAGSLWQKTVGGPLGGVCLQPCCLPANGRLARRGQWRQDVANNSGKEGGTWGISQTSGQVCCYSEDRSFWSKIEESLLNSATADILMRAYSIKELLRAA
jgi:hypothetical protein